MYPRGLIVVTVLGLAALLCACGQNRAAADKPAPPAAGISPPDLIGLWQIVGMRGGPDPYKSGDYFLKNQPPKPTPELTPEYAARQQRNAEAYARAEVGGFRDAPNSREARVLLGQCLPVGMPGIMGDPVESIDITQSRGHLTMVVEAGDSTEVRRIWMDRPQLPLQEIEPGVQGRSVGRWEGDTLVIDTTGFIADPTSDYSEQRAVTERLHLEGTKLINQMTITDPLALKKPWVLTYHYERVVPENYEPFQDACENSDQYSFDDKGNLIVGKGQKS